MLVTHEPEVATFASRVIVVQRWEAWSPTHGRTPRRVDPTAALRAASRSAVVNLWQTLRAALRAILRNKLRDSVPHDARHHHRRRRRHRDDGDRGAVARADIEAGFAAMWDEPAHRAAGLYDTSRSGVRGGFGSMPTLTNDDLTAAIRARRGDASRRRRARPAAEPRAHQRGVELDDQRHRHDARLLRHPELAHGPRDRLHHAGRRRRNEGRRPRPNGRGQALRHEHEPDRAGDPHRDHPVRCRRRRCGEGAVEQRAGLRRRRVHPSEHLRPQDPGALQQLPPGDDLRRGESRSRGDRARAEGHHGAPPRPPPPHRHRRRRLLHPQHGRRYRQRARASRRRR